MRSAFDDFFFLVFNFLQIKELLLFWVKGLIFNCGSVNLGL